MDIQDYLLFSRANPKFRSAVDAVVREKADTSAKLAAKMGISSEQADYQFDTLELAGVVGKVSSGGKREVLLTIKELNEITRIDKIKNKTTRSKNIKTILGKLAATKQEFLVNSHAATQVEMVGSKSIPQQPKIQNRGTRGKFQKGFNSGGVLPNYSAKDVLSNIASPSFIPSLSSLVTPNTPIEKENNLKESVSPISTLTGEIKKLTSTVKTLIATVEKSTRKDLNSNTAEQPIRRKEQSAKKSEDLNAPKRESNTAMAIPNHIGVRINPVETGIVSQKSIVGIDRDDPNGNSYSSNSSTAKKSKYTDPVDKLFGSLKLLALTSMDILKWTKKIDKTTILILVAINSSIKQQKDAAKVRDRKEAEQRLEIKENETESKGIKEKKHVKPRVEEISPKPKKDVTAIGAFSYANEMGGKLVSMGVGTMSKMVTSLAAGVVTSAIAAASSPLVTTALAIAGIATSVAAIAVGIKESASVIVSAERLRSETESDENMRIDQYKAAKKTDPEHAKRHEFMLQTTALEQMMREATERNVTYTDLKAIENQKKIVESLRKELRSKYENERKLDAVKETEKQNNVSSSLDSHQKAVSDYQYGSGGSISVVNAPSPTTVTNVNNATNTIAAPLYFRPMCSSIAHI